MVGNPAERAFAWCGTGDDHEVLVAKFIDRHVVDNPPLLIAHGRVTYLAGVHLQHVVDQQTVDEPLGSRPLDVYFAHGRQVLQADVTAGVDVFLDGRHIGQRQHVVAAAAYQLPGRTQVNVVKGRAAFRRVAFRPLPLGCRLRLFGHGCAASSGWE